jgi:4-amino-4-deoxy-L-arabinose transferase-like glycosyltransferase
VQQPTPESAPRPTASSATRAGAREARALLALCLAIVLLYGLRLGQLDLWAPDEPRYGAIAEELRSLRHGPAGLVLLRLNDVPYTQKPPLYFWLAALAGSPAGHVGELAARLPSAAAALGCVVLTWLVGRWLLADPTAALLAAGLLATSFRFAFTARRVQLDVLLTLCELAAVALFLWLELRRGGLGQARRHPRIIAALHLALGAAALVKGPVGWLPLAVFAGYLLWQGRLRELRAITPAWSWGLSIGPVVAWISLATLLAPPGFAEHAVGENLIGRFFAGSSHARPFYYYAYQLPLDFMPWTLLLPAGALRVWRTARRRPTPEAATGADPPLAASRFLLVWITLPLLLFSLSAGKRGLYLLPIFPALALITAAWAAGPGPAGAQRTHPARSLARLVLAVGVIELALFSLGLPLLDAEKSPRPIAEAAARELGNDERVGVYDLRPLEGGIAYYGRRRIASLQTPEELRHFAEAGGRIVVMRERHLAGWEGPPRLAPIGEFRRGRRQIAVTHVQVSGESFPVGIPRDP